MLENSYKNVVRKILAIFLVSMGKQTHVSHR